MNLSQPKVQHVFLLKKIVCFKAYSDILIINSFNYIIQKLHFLVMSSNRKY